LTYQTNNNDREETMKFHRAIGLAIGLSLPLALWTVTAQAAEIRVLCSNGLREVMEALLQQFEKSSGHTLNITFGLAAAFKRQIDAGEAFDLTVLTPPLMDDLIKNAKVVADSRTVIARAGMGLLTRKGGPKPDISTADNFKHALMQAKSITYPTEGASGVYFVALMERLAMAEALKPKLKLVPNAATVETTLTKGDAELGILPVSEIIPSHGVELIAPFPREVQGYIVMTAGVSAKAKEADAARDLIKFLTAPAAAPTIKDKHMEPGAGT
jgi:molybdate transport system substrate-binding protein